MNEQEHIDKHTRIDSTLVEIQVSLAEFKGRMSAIAFLGSIVGTAAVNMAFKAIG